MTDETPYLDELAKSYLQDRKWERSDWEYCNNCQGHSLRNHMGKCAMCNDTPQGHGLDTGVVFVTKSQEYPLENQRYDTPILHQWVPQHGISWMKPQEFFERSGTNWHDPNVRRLGYSQSSYDDVKSKMQAGHPLDPLWLEYRKGAAMPSHEGRHRALAAMDLGIDQVPVVVVGGKKMKKSTDTPYLENLIDKTIHTRGKWRVDWLDDDGSPLSDVHEATTHREALRAYFEDGGGEHHFENTKYVGEIEPGVHHYTNPDVGDFHVRRVKPKAQQVHFMWSDDVGVSKTGPEGQPCGGCGHPLKYEKTEGGLEGLRHFQAGGKYYHDGCLPCQVSTDQCDGAADHMHFNQSYNTTMGCCGHSSHCPSMGGKMKQRLNVQPLSHGFRESGEGYDRGYSPEEAASILSEGVQPFPRQHTMNSDNGTPPSKDKRMRKAKKGTRDLQCKDCGETGSPKDFTPPGYPTHDNAMRCPNCMAWQKLKEDDRLQYAPSTVVVDDSITYDNIGIKKSTEEDGSVRQAHWSKFKMKSGWTCLTCGLEKEFGSEFEASAKGAAHLANHMLDKKGWALIDEDKKGLVMKEGSE